jgi:hypothetical protein
MRKNAHAFFDDHISFYNGGRVNDRLLVNRRFRDRAKELREEWEQMPRILYGLPRTFIGDCAVVFGLKKRIECTLVTIIAFLHFLKGL